MPIRQRSQGSGAQSTAPVSPHSHWRTVFKFGHGTKDSSKKYGQPALEGVAPAPPSVQIHGPDYDDDPDSPRGATPTNDRGIDPMRANPNSISDVPATNDALDSPTTPAYPYEIDIGPSPITDEPFSDHSESPTASSESTSPPNHNTTPSSSSTTTNNSSSLSSSRAPSRPTSTQTPDLSFKSSYRSLSRRFLGAASSRPVSSRSTTMSSSPIYTAGPNMTPTAASSLSLASTAAPSEPPSPMSRYQSLSASIGPGSAPPRQSSFPLPSRTVSSSVLSPHAHDHSTSRTHLKDLAKSSAMPSKITLDGNTPSGDNASASNTSSKPSITPQASIKRPNVATRFIRRVASAPNVKNLFNVPGNRTTPPTVPESIPFGGQAEHAHERGQPPTPTSATQNGLLAPTSSFGSLFNAGSLGKRSRSKNRRGTTTSDDSFEVDRSSAPSSRRPSSSALASLGVSVRKNRANSAAPSPTSGLGTSFGSAAGSSGNLAIPQSAEEHRARFRRTYSSNSIKVSSVRNCFLLRVFHCRFHAC